MRLRALCAGMAACLLMGLLPAQGVGAFFPPPATSVAHEQGFDPPIDALSVGIAASDMQLEVRGFDTQWSAWQPLQINSEQDPSSHESTLVMFAHPVSRVQVRGTPAHYDIHPIRVSSAPAHYQVAALGGAAAPKILSRSDWGANEALSIAPASWANGSSSSDTTETKTDQSVPSSRVTDCQNALTQFPDEFKTTGRVISTNAQGQPLRWPESYSPSVRLLVIHHTADQVSGDPRPGVERMRALYQYHTVNRGWGDVGYHYVIDETGQIYEGRAGGDFVVGGHAYCNNVGTIGIALMGNFDVENPSQLQIHSLQQLLTSLGHKYQVDLNRNVFFHGKTLPSIVGHRQLVSTDCPGAQMWSALDQVRAHAKTGSSDADVSFPPLISPPPPNPAASFPVTAPRSQSSSSSEARVIYNADGLSALGSLTAAGRPGGELLLSFLYQANHPVNKDARIASVIRSHPQMQIWEEQNNVYTAVRAVTTPIFLSKGQSVLIRLKVHMPLDRGSFGVHIGSLAYVLESSGMRVHTQLTSSYQIYKNDGTTVYSGPQNSSSSAHAQTPAPSAAHGQDPHMIRIRLHDSADTQPATVTLSTSAPPTVSGQSFVGKSIVLSQNGNGCVAAEDGRQVASAVVRIDPGDGIATLASWQKTRNRFRGIMECRVIDGQLALINELPLEDYMAGLAEEPDTQAYEKQRAFAIAARTYAAYYLDPSHRKFPGQPYDGSDSPAEFQVYGGAVFESANPQWVRAVQTTMGNVLTVNGDGIKPPYFTSDDGRTRSPVEAGWGNAYPHAAVFASKPDPWCQGMRLSGHGVGMSGCGATGQAKADKTAEQILQYYYPGAVIARQ